MKNILVMLIVAVAVLWSGAAMAQKKPNTAELVQFEKLGGKILYVGKSYDLDGWLLIGRDGEVRSMIYTTAMGAMLKGQMFSPGGKNITKTQLQIYRQKMGGSQGAVKMDATTDKDAVPKAEQFYAAVEKANWVRVGVPDAPYIYMFINTGCEHCQSLFRTLKGSVDKGMLQLRILPAGEQEENRDSGAAMLSVEDPGAAWLDYMDGKKGSLHKTLIKGDALEKIKANGKLAKEWKLPQYPFTIYRKVSDGTLMTIVGQPENPMLLMSDLIKNP
ncbi:MAG TPA: hypothetical protein VEF76_10025 [Patescibacteria group bacterium]|nr:hypothetical protein [Patescibacteria group bacterium]